MKRLKMSSPAEIKRTINRISNMVLNEQLDPKRANAILYACNTALSSIRIDEQEKRLDELEKLVSDLQ